MTDNKTGHDRGDGATRRDLLQRIALDFPGNALATQRTRIQAAIDRTGYVTTTEARLYLEIMNPSQRVTELRHQGEEIDRLWTVELSEAGRDPHRQARYVRAVKSKDEAPTGTEPEIGQHELGKPARLNRKSKRTWRRKSGGAIRGDLLALLILATVAGLLLAGLVR